MSDSTFANNPDRGRHAVVAVIVEDNKYLVIRRSELVRAPGLLCFPGGGIEPDEDMVSAICRELREELSLDVIPGKHLWTSETRWGAKLEWIQCRRNPESLPTPNPEEVSEVFWIELDSLAQRSDLLGSLPDFIRAIEGQEITLE
jgi:8-oxo-dGTP diphosphatase